MPINFTEQEFRCALKEEKTWADLKARLKTRKEVIIKRAIKLGLDYAHLKHVPRQPPPKPKLTPIEKYFQNEIPIQSTRLKKRLIAEGFLIERCSICLNVSWLDQPIPLCLDHINGNPKDNSFKNLRLLCPNCHFFTPTFSGRGRIFFK